GHAGAARLVCPALQLWLGGLAGSGCGCAALGLRTCPRFAARPAPPECRVLHHERCHRHGVFRICHGGPVAAEMKEQGTGIRSEEAPKNLMRIAIQGEPGSFSHEAALNLVPDAEIVPC